MTPPLRPLGDRHVLAARQLMEDVGLAGGAANISRYLAWQPDGAWGWFEDDGLLGMVSLLRFGAVGFVGCMGVEPAHQGRGLGRALLEHAQDEGRRAGVTTFVLEATPIGAKLYAALGYVDEHETIVVERAAPRGTAEAAPIGEALPELLALDREATASARDAMIGGLVAECTGAIARAAGGALAAYGLVVGARLGPVIARDRGAGRAIIDRLAPACTVAGLPLVNEPAVDALAAHGFAETRRLRRMRLGPPIAARTPWLWTLASPGAG